jgi:universal stress protein A
MNIKSILFPTDFSQYNDAALAYASTLAAESKATLHIVHVHDPRELSDTMREMSYLGAAAWQQEHERAEFAKQLGSVIPTVHGVAYEHHCPVGRSDDEIVVLARDKDVDLIVMASHGRTGLSRLLMGSVAEAVMRTAQCPVLIVKQPAKADNQVSQNADVAAQEGVLL